VKILATINENDIVLAIAGVSDWLDGFIARRFNQQVSIHVTILPVDLV
jgi:phosphatidylserine synthase